jgi:hypothetical protein
MSQNDDHD